MILEPKYNLVSDCCSAPDKAVGDISFEDLGLFSECRDHCNYVPDSDEIDFITNETL